MTKKKIFLIGGNGFVGKSFQECFKEKYTFAIYDKSQDLLNKNNLLTALREFLPDYVINLASFSTIIESKEYEERMYQINVLGNLHITDALEDIGFIGTYLFVSSAEVYGYSKSKYFSENDTPNPQNEYAVAKLMGESLLKLKSYTSNYKIRVARPFNHFGENQSENFLIPKIVNQLNNLNGTNNSIKIGNLTSKRSYLHVIDICNAYDKILGSTEDLMFDVYNVCHNQSYSIPEFFDMAFTKLDLDIQFAESVKRFPDNTLIGSNEKIRALDWTPSVDVGIKLAEMIKATYPMTSKD